MTPPASAPVETAPPAAGEPAPPQVHELIADLHRLPAQRPALLRVVQVADDPRSSARALADAAAIDPAFTARLLQLANSAFYGRAGRVSSVLPAVGVLGAETVRGLAVTMALGLAGEHGPLPTGFWDRAAATATGSRLVARRVGVTAGDAFCVGLLHEVGAALLFRAAPQAYLGLRASCNAAGLAAAERAWCGRTHGEVAAAALGASGLPGEVCQVIADHQLDDERGTVPESPLGRALRGGIVLARVVDTGEVDDATTATLSELAGRELDPDDVRAFVLSTAAEAAALAVAMG